MTFPALPKVVIALEETVLFIDVPPESFALQVFDGYLYVYDLRLRDNGRDGAISIHAPASWRSVTLFRPGDIAQQPTTVEPGATYDGTQPPH